MTKEQFSLVNRSVYNNDSLPNETHLFRNYDLLQEENHQRVRGKKQNLLSSFLQAKEKNEKMHCTMN